MSFIYASMVGVLTALIIILILCITLLGIIFVLLIGKVTFENTKVKEEAEKVANSPQTSGPYKSYGYGYGAKSGGTTTSEYNFSDTYKSNGESLIDESFRESANTSMQPLAEEGFFASSKEETKKSTKLANVNIELPKNDWGSKTLYERVSGLSNAQRVLYDRVKNLLKNRLNNYTTDICEVYFNGENPAGRLIIYKNQILLFLSVDPDTVSKDRFYVKDVTNMDAYKPLSTLLLIKNLDQVNGIERLVDKILIG